TAAELEGKSAAEGGGRDRRIGWRERLLLRGRPRRARDARRALPAARVLHVSGLVLSAMPRDGLREEELEARWEAAPAVALVIAMQLLLALVSRDQHWTLWSFRWWVWLIPVVAELLLLVPLAWQRPRRRLVQLGHRRTVAICLLALVSLANAVLLLAVIA